MRARPDHSAEIARLVSGRADRRHAGRDLSAGSRTVGSRLARPAVPPDLPDFDSCRGWPGLIAILRLPDGERAPGIHRTFLLDDGSAKAPPGKKMLGSVKDAVVRLFPMLEDGHIGIAEGIETALAAHALFGTPVWAALSADGLARFQWPEDTRRVTIYAMS
ncbi:MAG: toprim domain-containing protein, partial [Rhodobacteraceae bacterium]|nr:toprim domain-containing protein [Paracoccaceae bacterium]